MQEDIFKELYSLTANKFNKFPISDDSDVINVNIIGISNLSSVKVAELHFHSHSFAELHFSLESYVIYQLGDGSTIRLEKGNWILMPENCPHKIVEYGNDYVKFSCSFSVKEGAPDPIRDGLSALIASSEVKVGSLSDFTAVSIKSIYSVIFNRHPLAANMLKGLSVNVIYDTLSPFFSGIGTVDLNSKNDDTRLAIAIQFIKDNLSRKINAEDVARKVYLSPRQLDRIFQNNMSISTSEFIYEYKCEEAKKLLVSTTLPIQTVGEMLGFSDTSYFIRFFKKRSGFSPLKFRAMDKKKPNSGAE